MLSQPTWIFTLTMRVRGDASSYELMCVGREVSAYMDRYPYFSVQWLPPAAGTVLQWIRGVYKLHPAFIANRILEILDSTEPNHWNHCPGQLNPADDDREDFH